MSEASLPYHSASFEAAGFGTAPDGQLPGFIGPVPQPLSIRGEFLRDIYNNAGQITTFG